MKERPILFKGEMVRAILEGRKTQTRRVLKKNIPIDAYYDQDEILILVDEAGVDLCDVVYADWYCPLGNAGDQLWVRERMYFDPDAGWKYYADEALVTADYSKKTQSCPSIHMPRIASRITLTINRVWVERVQDISSADVWQEGVKPSCNGCCHSDDEGDCGIRCEDCVSDQPQIDFAKLWDSINGEPRKDGADISWSANPWVWCVEFERVTA